MRIIAIRERAVPVQSAMRNAAFDFSEMTTSIVAVITDVMRGGKSVVGYAFNSTGRYACGAAMRERFISRLLSADPNTLLDQAALLDPAKAAARMALREKPGSYADGMQVTDGALNLPDCPGIGFERQPALFPLIEELAA